MRIPAADGAFDPALVGLPKAFPGAQLLEKVLENGLRVLVLPRRNLPASVVMSWIRAGPIDETPSTSGLSHFLEHLLFRGSRAFGPGVLDRITYREGGENNAFTGCDTTATYFLLPARGWRIALKMEADRMGRLLLRAKDVETERSVVLEEIRESLDNPWDALSRKMDRAAFPNHPYGRGILGSIRTIARVSRAKIARFYRRLYVPGRTIVLVAGDVEAREVFREAERLFGKRAAGPAEADTEIRRSRPRARSARIVVAEPEGRVARVRLSFPGPALSDPSFLHALVLSHIAGWGRGSRLWRELVDRKRLATTVSAGLDGRLAGGEFHASAEARHGVSPDRLERELLHVLSDLRRSPPRPSEIARVTRSLRVQHFSGLESLSETTSDVGYFRSLGLLRDFLEFPEALRRVSPEDVRAAARTWLSIRSRVSGHSIPKNPDRAAGLSRRIPRGSRANPFRGVPATRSVAAPRRIRGILPGLRREVLENGLVALALSMPSVPLVAIQASLETDSRFEPEGLEGLAALTGRLLEEGTRRLGPRELAKVVEEAGAAFDSGPGGIHSKWAREDLSKGIALSAEVLRTPAFREDAIRKEKDDALQAIESDAEDPRTVAHIGLCRLVYGKHPLGRNMLGTPESVRRIGPEAVRAFHARVYGPQAAIVACVGDLDPDEAIERIREAFGDWRRARLPRLPLPPIRRRRGGRVAAAPMERHQANIFLGHLGLKRTDPDYLPMLALNPILGSNASFTDRISKRLREQLGLAYSVHASATEGASAYPGLVIAHAGCAPSNAERVAQELSLVFRRLAQEGPTESEFENAKTHMIRSHPLGYETISQWGAYLCHVERYGIPFDACRTFPGRIHRLRHGEIRAAIRRRLRPDDLCLSVTGPGADRIDWASALARR